MQRCSSTNRLSFLERLCQDIVPPCKGREGQGQGGKGGCHALVGGRQSGEAESRTRTSEGGAILLIRMRAGVRVLSPCEYATLVRLGKNVCVLGQGVSRVHTRPRVSLFAVSCACVLVCVCLCWRSLAHMCLCLCLCSCLWI
jgi:hypothetical protein